MAKLDLRSRLFLSHLLVLLVGVASLVIIGKLSFPRFFVLSLERFAQNYSINYTVRADLVAGFEEAWNRSTLWSVILGTSVAGGLSYWMSQRIVRSLTQMEKVTQKFAAGELQIRIPTSDIPEIQSLAASFNRMAASLADVEERRREIIGNLTHELRTPLTVVHGYLEELADGRLVADSVVYDRLLRETSRLQRLVNDLQELSKAEAGCLPVCLQPVAVLPLLRELIDRFQEQLIGSATILQLDCPAPLPLVRADPDRLEQVLINLLGNAINYTPSGSITLRAENVGKLVTIAVQDTGIGIAPEDLPHVFERFWRSKNAPTYNQRGTGLGLAIAQRLMELQGGQISVESQPHQGSTFKIWLMTA